MRNLVAPHYQQPHLLSSPDPHSLALQPANQTPLKAPRRFRDGAVGLGIVAAMSAAAANSKLIAAQLRSEPIPIVSPRPWPRGEGREDAGDADKDEEELSESYTCVISHVAGSAVRKRVYFDDGSDGARSNYGASPGVFFQSPPAMNRCSLCAKNLHGLDIFMYRGDKAFCSSECRCQQILNDEYREKCNSGALKQFEYYTVSPVLFSTGVAAA